MALTFQHDLPGPKDIPPQADGKGERKDLGGRTAILTQLESVADALESALGNIRALISKTRADGTKIGFWEQEDLLERASSISLLRQAASGVSKVEASVASVLSNTIANINELSNHHTNLFRLPEEIVLRFLFIHTEEYLDFDEGNENAEYGVRRLGRKWVKLTEVCRNWNVTLKRAAQLWAFIDLSWPLLWNLNHPRDDSLLGPEQLSILRTHSIHELQLGVKRTPTSLKNLDMIHELLKASPTSLESLRVSLGRVDGDYHSHTTLLPPLPVPNLLHLRLHNCWASGPLPSSLRTVQIVALRPDVMTLAHVFQILSSCQYLESGDFEVAADDPSPNLNHALNLRVAEALHLPRLQSFRIRTLSLASFDWLCDRIRLDSVPSLDIHITLPIPSESTFRLPAQFQPFSRALSLSYSRDNFEYHLEDQFHHVFRLGWSGPFLKEIMPILDPSSFVSLQQLILRSNSPVWTECLHVFSHLRDLHLDTSVGELSGLSPILHRLSREPLLLCPQLCTLSLRALPYEYGNGDAHGAFLDERQMANATLEALLRSRADNGIRIQKLILSIDSCWTDDLDRWRPFVDIIEINKDTWGTPRFELD
ncbi:hypothetical protein SISNIDRAFT_451343 [Sistotremastrum niveocremeum HHB9708]|uniref:F-box domain-containing protein n=1 Tax=Sistotremastrum niveocremeum HHB9708 TaxID=1314777 RepID=A0A164X8K5_9AGAM|nr:hypothetical protein SISNIDRAFT_451343 [Sistotremastrum niveocremeum HHB9708]